MRFKSFCLFFCLLVLSSGIHAIQVGDYRFSGTGNWSNLQRWTVCSSVLPLVWESASSYPNDASISVFIQNNSMVTLDLDGLKVKDIHLNVNSNSSYGILYLGTRKISIYGIVSRYSGNAPGTVLPTNDTLQPPIVQSAAGTVSEPMGTLRFTGAGRTLSNSWNFLGTEGNEGYYPKLEIDMNTSNEVAIWDQRNRFKKVHVIRGVLHTTWTLRITNGSQGGDCIVAPGAVFESRILPGTQYNEELFCKWAGAPIGTFDLDGTLRLFSEDSILLMDTALIAGTSTIEYAGGNQNLISGNAFAQCYRLVLSGNGTKTLSQNVSIYESVTIKDTAVLSGTGLQLIYDPQTTLNYHLSIARASNNHEFPVNGPRHISIAGSMAFHESRTIGGNLTLLSGVLELGLIAFNVQGTLYEQGGTYSGGTGYLDGYNASQSKFLSFSENNIFVHTPRFTMTETPLMPAKINRQWTTGGSFSGSKELTFYWLESDDAAYAWSEFEPPTLYLNNTMIPNSDWGILPDGKRWLKTVVQDDFSLRGSWSIGLPNDQTLPLVLNSFAATHSGEHMVSLSWSTHSENSLSGFYILRDNKAAALGAVQISPLLPALNSPVGSSYQFTDDEASAGNTWYYWLKVLQMDGTQDLFGPVVAYLPPTIEEPTPIVQAKLLALYPNPTRKDLHISYQRKASEKTRLIIFNRRGQMIREINLSGAAGAFTELWDGKDQRGKPAPTGIYFLLFEAGELRQQSKIILMRD